MKYTNYIVIAEWEYATPLIIGWSNLEDARVSAKRIFDTSECHRVSIFEHRTSGLFDPRPSETLERGINIKSLFRVPV